MNKNKIIGNLYKKLLINNFEHEDIKKLLFSYNEFYSFNNFLFYLFKSATTKNNSLQHEMCKSIISYLEYLITQNNIHDFDLGILKIDNYYHPVEINSFKSTINILSINDDQFDSYKEMLFIYSIYPIERDMHIFINYQYKGLYKSIKHINYFVKDKQIISTLFINSINMNEYKWQEINNFIISRYWHSLSLLKNNLVSLLNKNKINDNQIYDNIYNSTNHFSCVNAIISFLIWTNNDDLYNDLIQSYGNYLLNYNFNISLLFDSISLINSQELVLLSNGTEILWGDHYTIDYKNNVYVLKDKIQYNDKNQLILYLFNNKDYKYFDSSVNKLILNTINNENKLYMFHKKADNKFLYLGSYKVKGIEFDQNNLPYFKLVKTIPNIENDDVNLISNNYINIFYNKLFKNENYSLYSNQIATKNVENIDISIDRMNSLLFKYNWIINKYMNNKKVKFAVTYQKFETTLILNISHIVNKNYSFVFYNKIMKNWAIASEMYKNLHIKELFNISFYDNDSFIEEQNLIIEKYV